MVEPQRLANQIELKRARIRKLEQMITYRFERVCALMQVIGIDLVEKEFLEAEINGYIEPEIEEPVVVH